MSRTVFTREHPAVKPLRDLIFLLFAVFLFWTVAANRSPNVLRPLSMTLRTGYTVVVPSLYLVLYLGFRLKGWLGSFLSIALTLSTFALGLAGVWAAGTTESGLLGGVIPMFNSANYYTDALRLLAGYEFSEDSSRRPLFTAFLGFLLWLARQDSFQALTLLTLLVALACFLLAKEIHRTHGPLIAVFVLVIVFIYYRYHSGVVRTENLGILFGALGTAAIWRGISRSRLIAFAAGVFLTSLGMVARAGAFFILPLLVLWGAFLFRQPGKMVSWRFGIIGTTAVLLAFVANGLITRSFGASDVVPFGNFSYSLYGLASGGKSWAHVLQTNPEAGYLEIYRLSFELILKQPGLFLKGVLFNYRMFFSNTDYGLFSYMRGEGSIAATLSYWILLGLSIAGMGNWFAQRRDPYLGFVMVSTTGLLLSVPFLPPTDAFRLRAYATSVVILALLPAMGLHRLVELLKLDILTPPGSSRAYAGTLWVFGGLVVAAVLAGPFAVRATMRLPERTRVRCNSGQDSLLVRYEPTASVQSVSQDVVVLDWAPVFHIGVLRSRIHDFPTVEFIDWFLENMGSDRTLFFGPDYLTYRNALVLAESRSLPSGPAWLELCGKWEDHPDLVQFNLFYAGSVNLVTGGADTATP